MSTAPAISTNSDLVKGSFSESRPRWSPKSSPQVTPSGKFRSLVVFSATARWRRDNADQRKSQDWLRLQAQLIHRRSAPNPVEPIDITCRNQGYWVIPWCCQHRSNGRCQPSGPTFRCRFAVSLLVAYSCSQTSLRVVDEDWEAGGAEAREADGQAG
jgi:hypothetical protein